MNINTMHTRFNLRSLKNIELNIANKTLKKSAVLVPLIIRNDNLHIILTKRCDHLRHHPGQISFPGGKFDKEDLTLLHTALRETQEELNIDLKYINVIGDFPVHHTASGFSIKPFIAVVNESTNMIANSDEVSEIIELPLAQFINNEHHFYMPISRQNIKMDVYFKPTNDYLIWGATASIIEQLRLLLTD